MREFDPAYTTNPTRYAWQRGIERPYACEISPTQYALLSKRGKREYDAKRRRDWDAWAEIVTEWKAEIIEAHEAGKIRKADLNDEAADVIKRYEHDKREKAMQRAAEILRGRWATLLSEKPLKAGDTIVHSIYGEGLAVKINRKTVVMRTSHGNDIKCDKWHISRKDCGEFAEILETADAKTLEEIAWHIRVKGGMLGFSGWQVDAIHAATR